MCGLTSRRGADVLITSGRVEINGTTVTELGTLVDEDADVVKVDGATASPVVQKICVALNKPRMTITSLHDPFKRRTVLHYLKRLDHRVYPIGRLDYDTEGLLLLTNDGDLAYRLAHPKYQIAKIYEARVNGQFEQDKAELIKNGIELEDGKIGHADVSVLGFVGKMTRIRLTLTEGRKREVKQLCQKVGHPVKSLCRVEFAGVLLKNLKPGQWRLLSSREIDRLYTLVGLG